MYIISIVSFGICLKCVCEMFVDNFNVKSSCGTLRFIPFLLLTINQNSLISSTQYALQISSKLLSDSIRYFLFVLISNNAPLFFINSYIEIGLITHPHKYKQIKCAHIYNNWLHAAKYKSKR